MSNTTRRFMMGAAGAAGGKTYIDDVFSTYISKGTGSTKTVTNGIDLSGEGGLVWTKCRGIGQEHILIDSERGIDKVLFSNNGNTQSTVNNSITSFNSNGFTQGSYGDSNQNNQDYASWTFRKAPGFFDIVTYTGNGSNRTIAHSLGSVPGSIWIKQINGAGEWICYHRGVGAEKFLQLNNTEVGNDDATIFQDTEPTASVFSLGTHAYVNGNSNTYVAYIFAGGESTAATARSVDITGGVGNYLNVQSTSSDLEMGSSDFTLELFINSDGVTSSNRNFFSLGNPVQFQHNVTNNAIWFSIKDTSNSTMATATSPSISDGQWHHLAVTRSGNTFRAFLDGTQYYTTTSSGTVKGLDGTYPSIGSYNSGSNAYGFNGKISNLRFVKGTAVYTSSFRPPTEPLTNITNTKLLCCNNSSVTGYTVSPAALVASGSGNPSASTDSPFDDPEGFQFGDGGDQNLVNCGSYKAQASGVADVYLGFEPQWIMIKSLTNAGSWIMWDSMRGIVTDGDDAYLMANSNNAESDYNFISLTPTGFKTTGIGGNNDEFSFITIRRPDGYVGKPPELGTSVLSMAYGNSAGTNPSYVSNFPVDFALLRQPATTEAWYTSGRLIQGKYLYTNTNNAETSASNFVFDHNNGWRDGSAVTNYLSWMWKRHAGFDVMTWDGDNVQGRQLRHNLNAVPEMIWVKCRSHSEQWSIYHKGLNGGTNPWNYFLIFGTNSQTTTNNWNDTAPTSTHFSLGSDGKVNEGNAHTYVGMLFASVDGISKVGSYTGNGSAGQTITTGFQPRFLIIKLTTGSTLRSWYVFDTTRGWASGNDQWLELNEPNAQFAYDVGQPTSTGFTLSGGTVSYNQSGQNYIYYAHA